MQLENEVTGQEIETKDVPVQDAADENTDVSEVEETEVETDAEDDGVQDDGIDKEMKTIKKALNKKNRYIENLRARNRALEDQMQKFKASSGAPKPPPQMEQFESVLDYVKAENAYELDKRFAEQNQNQQLTELQQQQAQIRAQQDQHIEASISELVTTNAEAKQVFSQALPVIEQMPEHIQNLFYEIDNAPAAAFALAKEGRLQDLYYMNPYIAAAELVQAQQRGLQYLATSSQLQKQPPKPLDGLRGNGKSTGKPLHQKSPDELMKWLNN